MTADSLDAILPAGGRLSGSYAAEAQTEVKALARIGGRTILETSIHSLKACAEIGRIVAIGPACLHEPAKKAGADAALDEGATGPENIFKGIEWLRRSDSCARRVLVCATDMPFLSHHSVSRFLALCPPDLDVCVPVVERNAFERVYPGLIRTDTVLADGCFRLGGLFLLDPDTLIRNRDQLEQVFEARKSNLSMARLIGLKTVWRYFTHRLTIDDIVARVSEIVQATGAVIKNAPVEIGFDVDLLEEYRYAVRYVEDRRA